jgi:hypothetical protein
MQYLKTNHDLQHTLRRPKVIQSNIRSRSTLAILDPLLQVHLPQLLRSPQVASNPTHLVVVIQMVQRTRANLDNISRHHVNVVHGLALVEILKVGLHLEEDFAAVAQDRNGNDVFIGVGMDAGVVVHDGFAALERWDGRVGEHELHIIRVEGMLVGVVFGVEGAEVVEKFEDV